MTPDDVKKLLEDAKGVVERFERAKAQMLALRDALVARALAEVEREWQNFARSVTPDPETEEHDRPPSSDRPSATDETPPRGTRPRTSGRSTL